MVLRVRVECFPELLPPALPKEDEPPARRATFCFAGESLRNPGIEEVLLGLLMRAVMLAVRGTSPPKRRLILPIGGIEDVVPPFESTPEALRGDRDEDEAEKAR